MTIREWAGLTGAPRTTGDLDGDGKDDRVLVLEPAVIEHVLPDDCIACQKPSWPRALVVLGAQETGWRLLGVADWGRASMEARIDRGRLLVTVGTYGGWSVRAQELLYRLEGGRFRLIGREVTVSEFCEGSEGCGEHVSENWLTHKVIVRRGEKTETSRISGVRWLEDGPPGE